MLTSGLIMWIVCLLVSAGHVSSITQHGYMTHYFFNHKPVYVNDSMILELTNTFLPDLPGKNYLTCDVNIVTSPSRRIMIHFLSLEISYADKEIDRLHIYDYRPGGEADRISPVQGLYGLFDVYYNGLARGVADYMSSGNRLKLDYQGKPTLAYSGFKILITSFSDARGECGRGYIRCNRKEICIPMSAWCDGYHNCGNHDDSDEVNCKLGLGNDWDPIDGQITAIVAASVSCTVFLITAAVVVLVVNKLNKRETLNHNITVEFKKKKATKRQLSTNGELYRLYAPPSYEVVIGMNEAPPSYQSVAAEYETGSDDDDDGTFREHMTRNCFSGVHGTIPVLVNNVLTVRKQENCEPVQNIPNTRLTSAIVTCDIDGNNTCSTELPLQPESSNCEEYKPADYLQQSNYRLCSSASPNSSSKKKVVISDRVEIAEIEVMPSDESDSEIDKIQTATNLCNKIDNTHSQNNGNAAILSNDNGTFLSNGTVKSKSNGQANGKISNGHTVVSYKKSLSKTEADTIDFMDSD